MLIELRLNKKKNLRGKRKREREGGWVTELK